MSVSTFLQSEDNFIAKDSNELLNFTHGIIVIVVIAMCFFKHENTMSKMLETVQRSNEMLVGSNRDLKLSNGRLAHEVSTYNYKN